MAHHFGVYPALKQGYGQKRRHKSKVWAAFSFEVKKPLKENKSLAMQRSGILIGGKYGERKIKFALRIAPETQQLVKELCERDNCQSQNEFIEKAIRFYAGYVSGKEATAYLPPALVAAMRGTVQDSENRIARLLFKLAVEVNMMMNVLAAGMEISDEDLKTLRTRSVREVKQTNGRISFKDAIDYQRGVE